VFQLFLRGSPLSHQVDDTSVIAVELSHACCGFGNLGLNLLSGMVQGCRIQPGHFLPRCDPGSDLDPSVKEPTAGLESKIGAIYRSQSSRKGQTLGTRSGGDRDHPYRRHAF
jgi:hypothetical protein